MAKEKKMEKEVMAAAQVLVLPFPVQGHINPMLQFATRLAARGIQFSLATTVFRAANMHADQLGPVQLCTISDGLHRGRFLEAPSVDAYHSRLDDVGPRTLADLLLASPRLRSSPASSTTPPSTGPWTWPGTSASLPPSSPPSPPPQWTDQPTNAKYMEDVWGVAIRARPDKMGVFRGRR